MLAIDSMAPFTKPETSPFTPGQPVPSDLFVGREEQVRALLERARGARGGRLHVGFLTGERGIGKTSLARLAARLGEQEFGLLALYVGLGGAGSPEDVVQRTFARLANVARTEPWWDRIKALFGERIRKVGLFGASVEFAPRPEELVSLTNRFDAAIREVIKALPEHRRGIFVVLDDINGLADSPAFATWLKNLVDTVAFDGGDFPVFLLFAGSDRIRRRVVRQHESVARIFDLVDLPPWSADDVGDFFRRAFASVGIEAEPDALQSLVTFAGGLPVLAHEIGDAAFRGATRSSISEADARRAIVAAADIVGRKYVEVQVLDRIRSGRYRALLRTIPEIAPLGRFKRSDLARHLTREERSVLDNFLREMVKLGMLERLPDEGPGNYGFVQGLHFLYFLTQAFQPGK